MKTKILVDSTSDLMSDYRARVDVVPLTVHFGEEEYVDGATIDHKTFYEKLVETDVLPSTSQATPVAFAQKFDEAAEAGEEVRYTTIGSVIGTHAGPRAVAVAFFKKG